MRSGRVVRTPTTPIARPDPVSASTSSGMAVLVMESPNELIPWPNRTARKSWLSRSRGACRGRRRRRGREVDRDLLGPDRTGDDVARLGALLQASTRCEGTDRGRLDPDTPREYADRVLQLRCSMNHPTRTTMASMTDPTQPRTDGAHASRNGAIRPRRQGREPVRRPQDQLRRRRRGERPGGGEAVAMAQHRPRPPVRRRDLDHRRRRRRGDRPRPAGRRRHRRRRRPHASRRC